MDIVVKVDGKEYRYDNPVKAYTDLSSRYNIPAKATQSILHYITSHRYDNAVIEYQTSKDRLHLVGIHVNGIKKYT